MIRKSRVIKIHLSHPGPSILVIGQVHWKQNARAGFMSNDLFMKRVVPEETDGRVKELGRVGSDHIRM